MDAITFECIKNLTHNSKNMRGGYCERVCDTVVTPPLSTVLGVDWV